MESRWFNYDLDFLIIILDNNFMKTFTHKFLIVAQILFLISCSKSNLTDNEEKVNFKSYQVAGCNHSASLEKTTFADSCFDYSFNDTLKIDFCIFGNCCPDSNRFAVDYNLNSDTISVSVVDTAANLCNCLCNYKIHLELTGLLNNKYIFSCKYDSIMNYNELLEK